MYHYSHYYNIIIIIIIIIINIIIIIIIIPLILIIICILIVYTPGDMHNTEGVILIEQRSYIIAQNMYNEKVHCTIEYIHRNDFCILCFLILRVVKSTEREEKTILFMHIYFDYIM